MSDQANEGILSPFLQRQRLLAARPHLKGRVLDFGCGSGAMASLVAADSYLGIDRDETSLARARNSFGTHRFSGAVDHNERFDSVVSLAVIEHMEDPAGFLRMLGSHMSDTPEARVVVTTPHPAVDWVHTLGARVGLFSRHASEEHEQLLDRTRLESLAEKAGLNLVHYRRFLLGANQLAVMKRAP